ncbi:MAG: TrbG/VirB9 family P-type conjugative transfer protein, partial [Pseudomonadota bacterium]
FPYSPGALYQVYVAPGQITDIALEPGEQLTGSGPVAAGDTVRWIIGDTESGDGDSRRVHLLVKPTRPAMINTKSAFSEDARWLWQDPFQVVEEHRKQRHTQKTPGNSIVAVEISHKNDIYHNFRLNI